MEMTAQAVPKPHLSDDDIKTTFVGVKPAPTAPDLAGGQNSQNNQDSNQHFQKNIER